MRRTSLTMHQMTTICTTRKATRLITLPTHKFVPLSLLPTTQLSLSIRHECGSCLCCLLLLVLRPTCFSPYDTLASALLLSLHCYLFIPLVCFGTKHSKGQMIPKRPSSMAAEPASHYHLTHRGPGGSDSTSRKAAGTKKNTAACMLAAMCLLDSHLLQMSV